MYEQWLERVRGVSTPLGDVEPLVEVLRARPGDRWRSDVRFDAQVPYGRTTVLAREAVELMVAGWTRGRPCAPHDHGDAIGAVQVLQGRAVQRGFSLSDGRLVPGPEQVFEPGDIVRCARGIIHQMWDSGGARPLITMHLYVGPTEPMVVYDLEHQRTQWLVGSCGAWPRANGDPKVSRWVPGFVPRGG